MKDDVPDLSGEDRRTDIFVRLTVSNDGRFGIGDADFSATGNEIEERRHWHSVRE